MLAAKALIASEASHDVLEYSIVRILAGQSGYLFRVICNYEPISSHYPWFASGGGSACARDMLKGYESMRRQQQC